MELLQFRINKALIAYLSEIFFTKTFFLPSRCNNLLNLPIFQYNLVFMSTKKLLRKLHKRRGDQLVKIRRIPSLGANEL